MKFDDLGNTQVGKGVRQQLLPVSTHGLWQDV